MMKTRKRIAPLPKPEDRSIKRVTVLLAILVGLLLGPDRLLAQTYTTNFDGTENPLSEGGAWSHDGLDWTKVQKVDGVAFGTQTGFGGYDDSYAYLSGFPADQSGSGVIQRTSGSSGIHEVEILLRWSDSAHSAKGYECLLSYDASYAQIVRWNGPFGDFTYIGWAAHAPFPQTGDTFSAAITGNLIIAYYNGVEIMRATDATYPAGNPGIGFFIQSNNSNGDMGFTSYTASGLGTTNMAAPGAAEPSRRLWLSQSEPNPFSRDARLVYGIPSPGLVTLKVYDLLGREMATLVDETKPAGRYVCWFGGASLNRGAYVARLSSGGLVETRKLLLMK
jgi:hypothetical protein